MTQTTKKTIEKAIEKAAETGKADPAIKKVEQALAKEERSRKPVTLPSTSPYTFKEGEQVTLVSANGKMRAHYEYVERLEKYDVIRDVQTGTLHRVWLNKLVPMSVAKSMHAAQQKAAKAS